jgi:anti-anti-sigma factor
MFGRLIQLLGLQGFVRWLRSAERPESHQEPPVDPSFRICFDGPKRIVLSGRWDASQGEVAQTFLDAVKDSAVVDFAELTYIASDGLGLIFAAQKRLMDTGKALKLANLNPHIREVFKLAAFDTIFEIE